MRRTTWRLQVTLQEGRPPPPNPHLCFHCSECFWCLLCWLLAWQPWDRVLKYNWWHCEGGGALFQQMVIHPPPWWPRHCHLPSWQADIEGRISRAKWQIHQEEQGFMAILNWCSQGPETGSELGPQGPPTLDPLTHRQTERHCDTADEDDVEHLLSHFDSDVII